MVKNTTTQVIIFFVLLVSLFGCDENSNNKESASLMNRTWVLNSFQNNNDEVTIIPGRMASTLYFNNDTGIVTGYVMCNKFTSNYNLNEEKIEITTVGPTEIFCGPDDEGQTQFVINTLCKLDKYSIENEKLILISTDSNILNFKKSEEFNKHQFLKIVQDNGNVPLGTNRYVEYSYSHNELSFDAIHAIELLSITTENLYCSNDGMTYEISITDSKAETSTYFSSNRDCGRKDETLFFLVEDVEYLVSLLD